MLTIFVVLTAAFCVSHAWEISAKPEAKPDKFKNQEGCYIKEIDEMVHFGYSTPRDNGCVKYHCTPSLVTYTGCNRVGVRPPCYTVETKEKPYPKCCPLLRCP